MENLPRDKCIERSAYVWSAYKCIVHHGGGRRRVVRGCISPAGELARGKSADLTQVSSRGDERLALERIENREISTTAIFAARILCLTAMIAPRRAAPRHSVPFRFAPLRAALLPRCCRLSVPTDHVQSFAA